MQFLNAHFHLALLRTEIAWIHIFSNLLFSYEVKYHVSYMNENSRVQGSHGREKGRELFFLFPTLKRSGRMIIFNKVGKRSGKMKSASDSFPKLANLV